MGKVIVILVDAEKHWWICELVYQSPMGKVIGGNLGRITGNKLLVGEEYQSPMGTVIGFKMLYIIGIIFISINPQWGR